MNRKAVIKSFLAALSEVEQKMGADEDDIIRLLIVYDGEPTPAQVITMQKAGGTFVTLPAKIDDTDPAPVADFAPDPPPDAGPVDVLPDPDPLPPPAPPQPRPVSSPSPPHYIPGRRRPFRGMSPTEEIWRDGELISKHDF